MERKTNGVSDKIKVKPELRPLIAHTEVGGGIKSYGDVEAPNDSQGMGSVENGSDLSRGKGRAEQRMEERDPRMTLTCLSKASEKSCLIEVLML